MSLANEPTYLPNGDLNPVFKPKDPAYEPYINVSRPLAGLDEGLPGKPHEHYWQLHESTEDMGQPVMCIICQMGKIVPFSAEVDNGQIIYRDQGKG